MTVAAVRGSPLSGLRACGVCGTPDALGLGTCIACGRGEGHRLLFLERPGRRADRRALQGWLLDGLGATVETDAAAEAAEGLRPIASLSGAAAARAVASLSAIGLSAADVPLARRWRRLPVGLLALMAGILAAGLFAASTTSVGFLLLSVAFVGLTMSAALKRLGQPIWVPPETTVFGLSRSTELVVRAALDGLGGSRAREALTDLATLAAGLVDVPDGEIPADVETAVHELLVLASDAALDLDRLDGGLAVLERQGGEGPIDVSIAEAVAKAVEARVLLVRKFDEALASLGRLQAATANAPRRLVEVAEQLSADAADRQAAWRTVERLTT
ncbi:MAG: hypothetical protein R3195_00925 [Gemmatimonadota bacterium]|nr:hypothetical protein [Gemmatimonadota bacterium]